MAITRLRSRWFWVASSRKASVARPISRYVPGHPPPAVPKRRYSIFHDAIPTLASAEAIGRSSSKEVTASGKSLSLADQHPPWTMMTTGNGPVPAGTRISANCKGSLPYANRSLAGGVGCLSNSNGFVDWPCRQQAQRRVGAVRRKRADGMKDLSRTEYEGMQRNVQRFGLNLA